MKAIIKHCELATSKTGAPYKHGMLNNGTNDVGFLAFPKFKGYEQIKDGAEIECLLTPTKEGDKFFVNDAPMGARPAWAKKDVGAQVEKAQDIKREDIKSAQERTQESVKMAGAQRDATLLVTTFYASTGMSDQEIKDKWLEWKKWLLDQASQPF